MQCQWCTSAIVAPPGPPPLDFTISHVARPEPPPDAEDSGEDYVNDSGLSGYAIARIVVAVVSLVILVAAAAAIPSNSPTTSNYQQFPPSGGGPSPTPTVNVSEVVVQVPDNACGLRGITPGAFSVTAGEEYPLVWWLPWSGGTVPCTVTNVVSDTPGFTVAGNFPLNVTTDQTPLFMTIYTPGEYNGVLTLTVD